MGDCGDGKFNRRKQRERRGKGRIRIKIMIRRMCEWEMLVR